MLVYRLHILNFAIRSSTGSGLGAISTSQRFRIGGKRSTSLAVCETLNFTRAAENCNVSQAALTHAVPKLEEELGGHCQRNGP
jgi:hypothetical protein